MNEIDLRRLDLNLLVVFEALMTQRHVGRAARRLGVTQSAVSHSLGRLRELFGDPLFARHPRGIEPTKRSIALAASVADVLNRTRTILASRPSFDPNQPYRFIVGQTDGSTHALVPLIERLRRTAPNVELHVLPVDANAVIGAIDRHEIDVALAFMPPGRHHPARIARTPLLDIRYVCIAHRRNPGLRKKAMSVEEFAALPHLSVSPRGQPLNRVDDLLAEAGMRRNVVLTVPHFLAAPLIVARTDLVAILDESIARLFAPDPNLKIFEIPVRLRRVTIDMLTAAARAEESALKWLREQFVAACRSR